MANQAHIKLTEKSTKETLSLEELKELLLYYKEITSKTGKQLGWHYGEAAFPYQIAETGEGKGIWFYLKSTDPENYKYIIFGIDTQSENEEEASKEQTQISIILPEDATHGDKAKANEFCKFIAKKLKGELHLFNSRMMTYY